jgi:hypothetical protein
MRGEEFRGARCINVVSKTSSHDVADGSGHAGVRSKWLEGG